LSGVSSEVESKNARFRKELHQKVPKDSTIHTKRKEIELKDIC
jgi:hypothetical protein